ncbi:MAG TPA: hypothetical protein VMV68_11005, partial [Spirochaetia bacterium]|nr:hypothetical protein [Spirochaetia bacterium]
MRQFVRWVIFAAIAGCVAITGTLIAQDISGSSSSGAAQTAVTSTVSSTSSESAAVQSLAAGGEAVPVSHPPFVRVLTTPTPLEYGVTGSSEVYVSQDSGKSWALRDKGLPLRVVYPFTGKEIEQITAIGADPLDPAHVAVTTSLGLWVSSDAGLQWSEIPLEKPIKSVAYVTSVAVSPWSPDSYALATSFSSVFETTDNGKHWTDLSDSLRFLYKGAGF